jgi:23S rRNA pseudouridine1911/1915/1917 synthase
MIPVEHENSGAHPRDHFLEVLPEDDGMRLDSYLSLKLPDYSRNQFKRWIQEGFVLVSGERVVKARHAIRGGDRISVRIPRMNQEETLTPEPMALDILFEDDHILVINKAPGVVVHPGAGHAEGTLVHGLLAHCPRLAMQGAPLRPGIVHRLDQDTSGALVIAKTERSYLDLIRQFKEHLVEKVYLALVHGGFSVAEGEIRTLVGRNPSDRKKMAVVDKGGREAVTQWRVEREFGETTLLRVIIKTGRTHQIRVHMSHIQHPVVGDAAYGGGKRRARGLRSKPLQDLLAQVDRQMLHAWRLGLTHPVTRIPISIEAELPGDFADLLRRLGALAGHGGNG